MNARAGGWLAVLATEVKVAVGLDRYVWFLFGWYGLLGRVSGEDSGLWLMTVRIPRLDNEGAWALQSLSIFAE